MPDLHKIDEYTSPKQLSPSSVSELTTCTLTGLSLYSLPLETACPKPSMRFPGAYYSMYFLNWCFSTLPKQTQFPVLELASVYLLFRLAIGWEENQGPRGRRKLSSVQSTLKKSESEVAQSCPTLCNPMSCSPPDSSVNGIPQSRALEWAAISLMKEGHIS